MNWLIAALVVVVSLGMSTFMSNTAAANLIVPIALALAVGTAGTRIELAILSALACSFAMAMPVSTPPNAMAFATGRIPVKAMVTVGSMISVLSVIVLLAGYKVVLPLIVRGL